MKTYSVQVEFEVIEFQVTAKNKREAMKKAITKLKKKDPSRLIKKSYPAKGREISIDEM